MDLVEEFGEGDGGKTGWNGALVWLLWAITAVNVFSWLQFHCRWKNLARFLWNESLDFQPALPRSAFLSSLCILCGEVSRTARKDPLAKLLKRPIANQAATICSKLVLLGAGPF